MVFNAVLYALALALLVFSYLKDKRKTKKALTVAWKSFGNLLPTMLGIIGLLGLMLAAVPREAISGLFGRDNPGGIFLISLVGAVTLMPAFIAFPLAGSLLAAGAGVTAVACFVTTLLMVGVLTAPAEAAYFGRRFTFWRNALGFAFALAIGYLMGVILP